MLSNDCLYELPHECLHELRTSWLPNMTDVGLNRLIDLLEQGSPLLIHGSFTRAVPMGCLATHIAWNHPATEHLTIDAGTCWLARVARLNPASSHLIREWDRCGACDYELRSALLVELKEYRKTHTLQNPAAPVNRVKDLATV